MEEARQPGLQIEKIDPRILYAEDEAAVRDMFTRLMGKRFSRVEAVENGLQLLEKLQSGENFGCIVMDDNMPGKRGLEVFRELRDAGRLETMPIILLTAVYTEDIKNEIERGGGFYLNKPITGAQLNETIEKAVEAKKGKE